MRQSSSSSSSSLLSLLTGCSLLLLLLSCATTTAAFAPAHHHQASSSSTRLFISSWGTKGPPSRWKEQQKKKRVNPEKDIQGYIPAPAAVDARNNLEGTVLISGLVNSKERTDQTMFDLINSEISAYEYTKIVAFVKDVKFSKKRLLSRHARYTGLLDKLDFVEATNNDVPTVEQLAGVSGWVAYVEKNDSVVQTIQKIAETANSAASVQNLAILLVGANDMSESDRKNIVESLKNNKRDDLDYTLVAVGELEETPEGSVPYRFSDFDSTEGAIETKSKFSRAESLRLITELLQLDCGKNKCLSFTEVKDKKDPAYILVKGLRAAGYPRPLEVDHMVRIGVEAYEKAIADYKEANPYGDEATSDNWWEDERFLKNIQERQQQREERAEEIIKDERTQEIELIAKDWAKREYFRQSMDGIIKDQSEEEFTKSVWDRALFEGDLKYRQMKGEIVDEENELADFKKRQEKKKEAMLQRAKKEMAELLEKEDLGDPDLEAKFGAMKASDDNTSDDD